MISEIKERLWRKNKNYLCVVLGSPGSGKSWIALSCAEKIDDNFSIDNVCFSSVEFIERLRSSEIKKGSVLVVDEAGVTAPAREFMSLENRRIAFIAQTFRHRNLCVFFCVPSIKFIDVQVRSLFAGLIQTVSIDTTNNKSIVKWFILQTSSQTGKIYRHYPTNSHKAKITRFRVSKPSDELIEAYEKKKKEFSDNLQEKSLKEIKKEYEKYETKEPNTSCKWCGYNWFYSGNLKLAKCTSCQKRTKTHNIKKKNI